MQIRLLGPISADHDGRDLALGAPRQRAVLAMLALTPGRAVSTGALVDGLWGDDPPGQPLASLQVYVSGLRRALAGAGAPRAALASRPPGYCLDLPATAVDLGAFERGWEESRRLSRTPDPYAALAAIEDALGLVRGPALADLRDFPFARGQVPRLDDAVATAREDRIDLALACGRHEAAVPEIEAMVAEHPTRERRWGQLMIALYRCHRQADALAAYARARDLLADELGIDPGEALQQLEVGILRHAPELAAPVPLAGGVPVDADAVRPRGAARLPRPTTRTFGRDELAGELAGRIASGGLRLLTLLGPGGTGKTRLATLVAREAAGFAGGRYFLEAEEGQPAASLLTGLVLALGGTAPLDPSVPAAADMVADAMPADPVLVVLDGLEAVPDAAYGVEALVKATSGLTVVATSRLPLRLDFEVEVVVPPIAVPPAELVSGLGAAPAPGHAVPQVEVQAVAAHPAVALFADRAAMVNHRFRLGEDNLADVVAVCRALDGVPLAIELAAAWMRMMTPRAALDRLASGRGLLSSGPLVATIEWSLAHLGESARELVADLSAFEAGFGLEAVEAVGVDPIEDLSALLECGLVQPAQTRVELRYAVLGPVRAYLLSLAGADRRVDRVRELHLRWMLDRLPRWARELDGSGGDLALGRFDDEHADLAALVSWALDRGRVAEAAELAAGGAGYWAAAGRIREGLELLRGFDGLDVPARLDLDVGVARLAYQAGDFEAAEAACRRVLAGGWSAVASCYLGAVLVAGGSVEEGAAAAEAALGAARRDGQPDVQAMSLSVLAIAAAMTGDLGREREHYEERLRVTRASGDRARTADTLTTLAEIALDAPDLPSARDHVAEALRLAGEHRPMERRDGLITSARVSLLAGEPERARAELEEALRISARVGAPHAAAQAARVAGCLSVATGDSRTALRLFAVAGALAPAEGEGGEPLEPDLLAGLQAARAGVPPDEARRLWAFAASDDVTTASVVALARASL